MPLIDAHSLPEVERLPGWNGRFFDSKSMTFAYYEVDADAVALHEHQHPQEEVWHIVEGALAITIDGTEHIARAGSAAIVPPGTPHSARVLGSCKAIVVDQPRREITMRSGSASG